MTISANVQVTVANTIKNNNFYCTECTISRDIECTFGHSNSLPIGFLLYGFEDNS